MALLYFSKKKIEALGMLIIHLTLVMTGYIINLAWMKDKLIIFIL